VGEAPEPQPELILWDAVGVRELSKELAEIIQYNSGLGIKYMLGYERISLSCRSLVLNRRRSVRSKDM